MVTKFLKLYVYIIRLEPVSSFFYYTDTVAMVSTEVCIKEKSKIFTGVLLYLTLQVAFSQLIRVSEETERSFTIFCKLSREKSNYKVSSQFLEPQTEPRLTTHGKTLSKNIG